MDDISDDGDKILEILLEGHRAGIERAIDDSIRTGVPLVVMRDGEIFEIPPQYKYVRVPIDPPPSPRRLLRR